MTRKMRKTRKTRRKRRRRRRVRRRILRHLYSPALLGTPQISPLTLPHRRRPSSSPARRPTRGPLRPRRSSLSTHRRHPLRPTSQRSLVMRPRLRLSPPRVFTRTQSHRTRSMLTPTCMRMRMRMRMRTWHRRSRRLALPRPPNCRFPLRLSNRFTLPRSRRPRKRAPPTTSAIRTRSRTRGLCRSIIMLSPRPRTGAPLPRSVPCLHHLRVHHHHHHHHQNNNYNNDSSSNNNNSNNNRCRIPLLQLCCHRHRYQHHLHQHHQHHRSRSRRPLPPLSL